MSLPNMFVGLMVDKKSVTPRVHAGQRTLYVLAGASPCIYLLQYPCLPFSILSVWFFSVFAGKVLDARSKGIPADRMTNEKHNWLRLTLANGLHHISWFTSADVGFYIGWYESSTTVVCTLVKQCKIYQT